MFEKVKFLTYIVNNNIPTYYFYHRKTKTIIPVKIEGKERALVLSDSHPSQPKSAETLKKIIFFLGLKILCIKIYLYQDSYFYTYLTVKEKEEMDISVSFIDAINLASLINTDILFEKSVIKECGFKVTRKMIERALIT